MTLNDKVAVITGAGGGFGRAFCESFLEAGAHVVGLDRELTGLAYLSGKKVTDQQNKLLTKAIDISKFSECEDAISETVENFGRVDILVNNAGLGMGSVREDHHVKLVGIDEVTPEIWENMLSVNLTGPWNMTKASITALRDSPAGRILNVTTSFFTMLRGKFHPYGPSKSGFEAMSAGHASEFLCDGITVNVIVPGGPADTPMVPEGAGWDRSTLVSPIKMTYPAIWLCSDEAKEVSGKRFVAGAWDPDDTLENNRANTESPIGWPELAQTPIWPGGKPE